MYVYIYTVYTICIIPIPEKLTISIGMIFLMGPVIAKKNTKLTSKNWNHQQYIN